MDIELKDGDVFYTKHTAIQKSKSNPDKWVITDVRVVNVIEIPENATRKEIHKLIFGIDPPELDSPYCACAVNCADCEHNNDSSCDVKWWNEIYKRG